MYTGKLFVFFVLFATGVVSTQTNVLEWLESKLNKNTSMLKEVLAILRKENTPHLREVAYGRNSYQSSTLVDNGTPYPSNLAVDGNMSTFMHTQTESSPYWEIDLGKNYQIKRVEIYNRRDCCGERLHDLDITVGLSHNMMSLCNHYTGPAKNRSSSDIQLPQNYKWPIRQADDKRKRNIKYRRSQGVCYCIENEYRNKRVWLG